MRRCCYLFAGLLAAGVLIGAAHAGDPQGDDGAAFAAKASASALPAPDQRERIALQQFLQAQPRARLHQSGSRITRVYGTTLQTGIDPVDSAERFIMQNAEMFGAEMGDLEPISPLFDGRHTQPVMVIPETGGYKFTLVYYSQFRGGIPVFRSDVRLLVRNESGYPLVLVSSGLRKLGAFQVGAGLQARARRPEFLAERFTAARQSALNTVPDLVNFTDPETVIWAGLDRMEVEPRVALKFIADNFGPGGAANQKRLYLVDLSTGEILYEESAIIDVDGNASGLATEGSGADICGNEVSTALPHLAITSGANSTFTDAGGNFTLTAGGGTVDATLSDGRWFDVFDFVTTVESLSLPATTPANFLFNSANSSELIRAQTNGYVSANVVRDFTALFNPAYPTFTDTNIPCWVNRTDGFCPGNAWYDPSDFGSPTGYSINFCQSGPSRPNTAWSSVIYHEFGHHLVQAAGSGQGQYGEGTGDCMSVIILDDNRVGLGFFGTCDLAGTLRNADNTIQYPCSGEIHDCGRLIAGCIWSTRNELIVTEPVNYTSILGNLEVNSILVHTGTEITPSITTDWLVLDDDNGDLGDGTPHFTEITTGFGAHNMWAGPPPANDPCSGAFEVCPGTPVSGNTAAGTNDGASTCGTSDASPDLWYFYTPESNGTATFSLCSGTNYDSVLSVHSGCPGTAANDLGCDDDFCAAGGPSQVTIAVTAGNSYRVRVTGWSGSAGNFTLTVTGPNCAAGALSISFPNGLPAAIEPGIATTFDVLIQPGTENYVPGTAALLYRYGGGTYLTAALTPMGGDLFQATLPAAVCADTPEFYISAQGDGGTTIFSPADAPTSVFTSLVGTLTTIMSDNFETDQGWVASNLGATTGDWARGVPVNDPGWDYDPISDSDGSGQCYLTQNQTGNTDVDNGAVRLTSPVIDMSGGNVTLSYDYYLRLTDSNNTDFMQVEISSNGDAGPWTEIARHVTDGGLSWRPHTITQADLDAVGVTMTANMKLRYTTNDANPQSINESGLDAFRVERFVCVDVGCTLPADGDMDLDGKINGKDLQRFVDGILGTPTQEETCHGDFDADTVLNIGDVGGMVSALLAP